MKEDQAGRKGNSGAGRNLPEPVKRKALISPYNHRRIQLVGTVAVTILMAMGTVETGRLMPWIIAASGLPFLYRAVMGQLDNLEAPANLRQTLQTFVLALAIYAILTWLTLFSNSPLIIRLIFGLPLMLLPPAVFWLYWRTPQE